MQTTHKCHRAFYTKLSNQRAVAERFHRLNHADQQVLQRDRSANTVPAAPPQLYSHSSCDSILSGNGNTPIRGRNLPVSTAATLAAQRILRNRVRR